MSLSHWWGFASLPEGIEYPYNGTDNPLTLVCQFTYGNGIVYIFADLDYFLGDLEAESGGMGLWPENFYKVIYAPVGNTLNLHEIRHEDGTSAVPEPEDIDAPARRDELTSILKPAILFRDELEQEYPDYRPLVTVEENDSIGLRFYDCGILYFLIKDEDLDTMNFDNVICVLYSY